MGKDDIENRRFEIEAGQSLERRTGLSKTDKSRYVNTSEGRAPVWEKISSITASKHGFLMLVGGILLLIILFTFVVGTSLLSNKAEITSKTAASEALQKDDELRARLFNIVSAFRTAESVEEKVKFVRRKETVEPLLRAFYDIHSSRLGEEDIVDLRIANRLYRSDEDSDGYIYITAGITQDGKSHPYVIEERKGQVAIDWETAVAYNPMTRDELLKVRPSTPIPFRVYLGQTDRYIEPFGIDDYLAVQLIFPDKIETVDAFISRRNSDSKYIIELLTTQHLAPAILNLKIPEDFNGEAVLIDSFVQPNWFISE